jgi:peptidoglycan/LPS O-acetylase OafA/YrhL
MGSTGNSTLPPRLRRSVVSDALVGRPAVALEATDAATAPAAKQPFHIPSLDGIRAVSFLIVLISHAGLGHIVPGGLGVTIFFFLSGYLITTLLRMEYAKSSQINLRTFYIRRVLRIFPPFYLMLAIATILTAFGVIEGELKPMAVLSQVFYLNNYYVALTNSFDGFAPGTGIYWSLAVEEHFYLFFPLLFIWMQRSHSDGRRQALMLGAITLAVLIWRCVLVFGFDSPENRTYVATDARLDSIIFGCMLAVFMNPMLDKTTLPARQVGLLWLPLGIGTMLFTLVYRDSGFRETFRYTLQGLALLPIFYAAVRFPNWLIFRPLNIGWVSFMGVLSYSLYLIHQVVLVLLEQYFTLPLFALGPITLFLSLLVALAIYYAIEKPLALYRRRMLEA